jgi:transposase
VLGPLVEFIDAILLADRRAPRKQRHTAHRIFVRIRHERPECPVAEPSIRRYVRQRKAALGLLTRETFVPQAYDWGDEAQVDWYEAYADLDGERQKCQVFSMRSMASSGAFHRAYLHATQQAFLEAHELAFAYFGGVFRRLRYDNLGSAVKRVLRGSRREETSRFIAFRSHWRYEAEFCTPGEGHEKGGVEGEVGTFAAITGCRCRRHGTLTISTIKCWPAAALMKTGSSRATPSRSVRRWRSSASISCPLQGRDST